MSTTPRSWGGKAIAPRIGVGAESLRRWVQQALVDGDAQRPGVKTVEKPRIRELERRTET